MDTGASDKAAGGMLGPTGTPHWSRDFQAKPGNISSPLETLDERFHMESLSARQGITTNETKAHKTSDAVRLVGGFRENSQLKPVSLNNPKGDGAQMSGEKNTVADKWEKEGPKVSDVFGAAHKQCKIVEPKGAKKSSVGSNSGSVSSVRAEAAEIFEFDSSNLSGPLPSPQFITKPALADAVKAPDFESSSLTLNLGLHRIKTRSGPLREDGPRRKVEEVFSNSTSLQPGEETAVKAGESLSRRLHCQSESQLRGSDHFLSGDGSKCRLRKDESCFDSAMLAGSNRERVILRARANLNERSVKNLQTSAASTSLQTLPKDPMSQSPGLTEDNSTLPLTFQGNVHKSSSSAGVSRFLDGSELKSKEVKHCRHRTERKVPSCRTPDLGSDCNRENDTEGPKKELDVIKETASTKFQAISHNMRASKKKRLPNNIKSFSHELGPSGGCSHVLPRPHSDNDLEEVLGALKARFNLAKEEVNVELSLFAAYLVDVLDNYNDAFPGWQKEVEDLLVVARHCTMMSPCDFRHECENIVHELDDRRQQLPMGLIKQLHIRMLFILSRCTRLLQFQKDTAAQGEGHFHKIRKCLRGVPCFDRTRSSTTSKKEKRALKTKKVCPRVSDQAYGNELPSSTSYELKVAGESSCYSEMGQQIAADVRKLDLSEANRSDYSKVAAVLAVENVAKMEPANEFVSKDIKLGLEYDSTTRKLQVAWDKRASAKNVNDDEFQESAAVAITPPKQAQRGPQGYWTDQESMEEPDHFICRICEEDVPTSNLEAHSVICAFADNCDGQGLSLNERLKNLVDFLERLPELSTLKNSHPLSGDSPDMLKSLKSNLVDSSDGFSPIVSEWHGRVGEVRLDDLYASDHSSMEEPKVWSGVLNFKPLVGPKSSSSAGSLTPRSALTTPRTSQLDLFWADQSTLVEYDDVKQICELADIARCVANKSPADEGALEYLATCMQDLQDVLDRCKNTSFTVGTFGRRIENILREKYMLIYESNDHQKLDMAVGFSEDDGTLTDDNSLRSTPVHPLCKDRTTIDDFEILKPISRGAFGRVFLARKRTTGDFFAIKVLRKIDMIRKNAVENILAERDILITVCNPFVVRFFYSFTSRENLYLVMEYLNGGDLYSLLRNLGCLEEHVVRVYIAELVLALEYLHSLGVVHRDLKPDNILIAHDGHIKLTDFGLSKVGLINSTDEFTGPASNGTILTDTKMHGTLVDNGQEMERHRKHSAVGTPDYLAPEILLGTEHAHPADWWSTGVILFECLTGIPPFNAEHPQIIFDNILNRKIPWPNSEIMSTEARDLIDKLLIEDPKQRLGSRGAAEVKSHPFFKDINWDTLARQKAAFVPSPESIDDTSYFTPRHPNVNSYQGYGDSSDCSCSSINTSSLKGGLDEEEDQCADLADFESSPSVKDTFNNFSFKNLSQLASINYDHLSQNTKEPLKKHSRQSSAS